MEVHVQQCQFCGHRGVRDILVREEGEPDRVFVQCLSCESLVATYVIAPLGYYHHGKGFESFLRGLSRSGEFASGRRVKEKFDQRKQKEQEKFKQTLEALEEKKNANQDQ